MDANVIDEAVIGATKDLKARLNPRQLTMVLKSQELRAASKDLHSQNSSSASTRVGMDSTKDGSNRSNAASRGSFRIKTRSRKSRRSLNGFMAFRAYYSPLLRGMPQKFRSRMLSIMWKEDPAQASWSLLAATFTTIRDNGGEEVLLDRFLDTAVNTLKIIPADRYMEHMGWEIKNGVLVKCYEPKPHCTQVNVSTDDLIKRCTQEGLVSEFSIRDSPKRAIVPCAVTSQTIEPERSDEPTLEFDQNMIQVSQERLAFDSLDPHAPQVDSDMAQSSSSNFIMPDSLTDFNFGAFDNSKFQDAMFHHELTFDEFSNQQQYILQEHGYSAQFDPQIEPPLLHFDPTTIQNAFDPWSFEVDSFAYLNSDVYEHSR